MARVAGVDLPRDKRGEVSLTYILGIGRSSARRILTRAGVDLNRRVREWTEDETARVREVIDREQRVEGDLRREVTMNIKRLMDIGSYRGSPAPEGPARSRAADPYQCADPEGPAAGCRHPEEGHEQEPDDGEGVGRHG